MRSCRTKITVVTTDEASSQHILPKSQVWCQSRCTKSLTYVYLSRTSQFLLSAWRNVSTTNWESHV